MPYNNNNEEEETVCGVFCQNARQERARERERMCACETKLGAQKKCAIMSDTEMGARCCLPLGVSLSGGTKYTHTHTKSVPLSLPLISAGQLPAFFLFIQSNGPSCWGSISCRARRICPLYLLPFKVLIHNYCDLIYLSGCYPHFKRRRLSNGTSFSCFLSLLSSEIKL